MRTPRTTSEVKRDLGALAAKRVDPRKVSAAAQHQYVVVRKDKDTVWCLPDYPGRVTGKERQRELYITQVDNRSINRDLDRTGNTAQYGPNGELVAGFGYLELPTGHKYTGVPAYEYVGPVATKAVTGIAVSWTKHRAKFRRMAADRLVYRKLVGYVGDRAERERRVKALFADED